MKRYAFVKAAQAVGLGLLAFVLLRLVGPWLVDLHSTPALILAAALLIAGGFAVIWFAWNLVSSIFRARDVPTSRRMLVMSKRTDPHA